MGGITTGSPKHYMCISLKISKEDQLPGKVTYNPTDALEFTRQPFVDVKLE